MMVARLESDIATCGQLLCGCYVWCQPLVEHCTDDCATQGTRHALPGDWRPGMQEQVFMHPRNYLTCWSHIHQAWASGNHALCCILVGLIYSWIVQQHTQGSISVARCGLPGNTGYLRALGSQRIGKEIGADINDMQGKSKKAGVRSISHDGLPPLNG